MRIASAHGRKNDIAKILTLINSAESDEGKRNY
jgi:hypothetical protein